MRSRFLMAGLIVAVLSVPTLQAQARRESMIGVRLSDVTAENVKTLKLSKAEGAVVETVNPNSPAATAGLREKDVIVQFDGERVRSASHLSRLVAETPAGREMMLSVMREGTITGLRITPAASESGWFDPRFGGVIEDEIREQVESATRDIRRSLPDVMDGVREGMSGSNRAHLGVSVQPLSGDLAGYFGVKSGVLVASVSPDSPAAKAGLKAGDVITAVNGQAIATPRELVRAMPASESSQDVALSVVRDKKEMTVKATLTPASAERRARGQRV